MQPANKIETNTSHNMRLILGDASFLGKMKVTGQTILLAHAPLQDRLSDCTQTKNYETLKVTAVTESGGSWTLAFPSLTLTVFSGSMQMVFGFS
jgi:hypothetical protein